MGRILHLIPTLEGGGAERQLAILAAEQSKHGWDVHIGMRRSGVHIGLLRHSQVTVHQLGDCRGVSPLLFLRINSLMRKLKPDIVQTWLPQMDITGGVAALWNAVPWVLTERASKAAFSDFSLLTWLRLRIGCHANAVVANSAAGARYWKNVLSATANLQKIPNAVDVVAIRNAAPASNEILQGDKKLILVVGRLSHQKAVEVIVQAVSFLTNREDYKVLIIGEGPLRHQIETRIKTLGIENCVLMLPYQPEWWGFLKRADALVSMSRYEGNPNVVLEAMAAGCPLIVSDIPEHREFLSEDSAVFVPVDSSFALAASITSFFSDPDSACKRSGLAKGYVQGLSIQFIADAYESVYGKVLSERQR